MTKQNAENQSRTVNTKSLSGGNETKVMISRMVVFEKKPISAHQLNRYLQHLSEGTSSKM